MSGCVWSASPWLQMFGSLSERLQSVFAAVRREARLTPESVETALREIRLALLEADVNFKVVRAFIDRVRDRAVDGAVLESLTPTQQVVAIVRDELRALLGDGEGGLAPTRQRPQVVLLLGLQGAGKTTTTVKLAKWLEGQGRHALVVSTDVRRPAAIEQLGVLAREAGRPGARAGSRHRCGGPGEGGGGVGARPRVRRGARRYRGTPAHRRRPDAGARDAEGGRRAVGFALCGRRDDGAGRRSRAPASSTGGWASTAWC